jgi:hypothetical protein
VNYTGLLRLFLRQTASASHQTNTMSATAPRIDPRESALPPYSLQGCSMDLIDFLLMAAVALSLLAIIGASLIPSRNPLEDHDVYHKESTQDNLDGSKQTDPR